MTELDFFAGIFDDEETNLPVDTNQEGTQSDVRGENPYGFVVAQSVDIEEEGHHLGQSEAFEDKKVNASPSVLSNQPSLNQAYHQHLYARATRGYGTVATSPGLPQELLINYSKYGFEAKNFHPKVRYAFSVLHKNQTYQVLGQAVHRHSHGRSSALIHQYVTEWAEGKHQSDLGAFVPTLEFIDVYDEDRTPILATVYPPSLGSWQPVDTRDLLDEETFASLVLDVIKVLEAASVQLPRLYLSLPVSIEEQTDAALRLLTRLYACLPWHLRQKLGYITYYTGQRDELGIEQIFLCVVPQGLLNSQHKLGELNLGNKVIYALDSSYFHNRLEDTYAFSQVFREDTTAFYSEFDRLRTPEMIERFGNLGALNQFWTYQHLRTKLQQTSSIANKTTLLLAILDWAKTTNSYEQESVFQSLVNSYLDDLGYNQLVDSIFLEAIIGLGQSELVFPIIEQGLANARYLNNDQALLNLILATKNHIALHQQLLNQIIVPQPDYLLAYITHRLSTHLSVSEFFDDIKKVLDLLGEPQEVLNAILQVIHQRQGDFRLTDCTQRLCQQVEEDALIKPYVWFVTCQLERLNVNEISMESLQFITLPDNRLEYYHISPKAKKNLQIVLFFQETYTSITEINNIEDLKSFIKGKKSSQNWKLFWECWQKAPLFSGGTEEFKRLMVKAYLTNPENFLNQFLLEQSKDKKNFLSALSWCLNFTQGQVEFKQVSQIYLNRFARQLAEKKDLLVLCEPYLSSEQLNELEMALTYGLEKNNCLSFLEKQKLKFSKAYQSYKKKQVNQTKYDYSSDSEPSLDRILIPSRRKKGQMQRRKK